jgi:hypothetical protein
LLLGLVGGFAFPGFLMFYSGITGGEVPVNYAGFTVILFPLSIGYAIVKYDLFEIDALLKRSVYYMTLSVTLALGYLGFLGVTGWGLHSSAIARSTYFPLLFTLIVIVFLGPLKDAVQQTVDRVFPGSSTTPRTCWSSPALCWRQHCSSRTSSHSFGRLSARRWEPSRAVSSFVRRRRVFTSGFSRSRTMVRFWRSICSPQNSRLQAAPILSRHDLDDNPRFGRNREAIRQAFDSVSAELLIPLALKRDLIGFRIPRAGGSSRAPFVDA